MLAKSFRKAWMMRLVTLWAAGFPSCWAFGF